VVPNGGAASLPGLWVWWEAGAEPLVVSTRGPRDRLDLCAQIVPLLAGRSLGEYFWGSEPRWLAVSTEIH